ncbi:hypothetical protein B566_EDAN017188 [Ephemera danica]|nr:hypothetical protein B566_EDAN017188 [Ephemera danica]
MMMQLLPCQHVATRNLARFNLVLLSFINWPVHHPKSATELADAGFFYTGCGDRVICFHCGGGVKDWMSGDSPWVEHSIWFGNCDFLVANKGQQFVEKVKSITSMQNTNKSGFSEISAEVHEYKVEEMKDENINEHKNDEVEEMKKLENSRTCKICFEKELSILFLPCGHLTACSECAPKMHNCPICRLHPVAYIRAYLP